MDANGIKAAKGTDLDAIGEEMKLPRATIDGGHAFDETDDSYQRRLLAGVIGAEAAGALSQPSNLLPIEAALPSAPALAPPAESQGEKLAAIEKANADRPKDKDGLFLDGPTIEEWVLAGYAATGYPPHGYASRSTPDEIAAAVAAQKAAHEHADLAGKDPEEK